MKAEKFHHTRCLHISAFIGESSHWLKRWSFCAVILSRKYFKYSISGGISGLCPRLIYLTPLLFLLCPAVSEAVSSPSLIDYIPPQTEPIAAIGTTIAKITNLQQRAQWQHLAGCSGEMVPLTFWDAPQRLVLSFKEMVNLEQGEVAKNGGHQPLSLQNITTLLLLYLRDFTTSTIRCCPNTM